jgi:hypothetical protein
LLFLFVSLLGEEEKNLVASPSQEDDSVYAEAEEPPHLVLADLMPGSILRTENTVGKGTSGIPTTRVKWWGKHHDKYRFWIFCNQVYVPGSRDNENRVQGDHTSQTSVDFQATLPDGRGEGIIDLQFCRYCPAHWMEGSVFLQFKGLEMVGTKEMVSLGCCFSFVIILTVVFFAS